MNNTIKQVSISDLKELLKDNKSQVIDVREKAEYERVRIPGTKLVPLSEFEKKYSVIDRNRPVYIHCGVGSRAQKAAEYLSSVGYENLYVIDGGIKAWIEAGYPVEQGQP